MLPYYSNMYCQVFSCGQSSVSFESRTRSFYLPKDSTKAQLLEAKANLLRLRQDIPLADAELTAVEELTAYEQLPAKLADVPTPAGPTPRQLGREHLVQLQANEQPERFEQRKLLMVRVIHPIYRRLASRFDKSACSKSLKGI